jgi:hypothetical protein
MDAAALCSVGNSDVLQTISSSMSITAAFNSGSLSKSYKTDTTSGKKYSLMYIVNIINESFPLIS